MAYKLIPRLLHAVIHRIEFSRIEAEPGPFHGEPVYHFEITVNDEPHSFDVVLYGDSGCSLQPRPEVFGTLKYPDGFFCGIVHRFHQGEAFTFPLDVGDIGIVVPRR